MSRRQKRGHISYLVFKGNDIELYIKDIIFLCTKPGVNVNLHHYNY